MKMRYFFSVAVLFSAAFAVTAATVDFRSGTVLAAEFTNRKPEVKLVQEDVANRIFARMVIKLAPERKLSIYDYQLHAFGRGFKAVAVSVNNGKWLTGGEAVENIDGKTRVSLLFVVDGSVIGKKDSETFEVIPSALPNAKPDVIKFKNIKDGRFSSVTSIPESGWMVK